MKHTHSHTTLTFPSSRLFTMDIGVLGLKKHHIKAFIEVDVTDARINIKKKKQEGAHISFTAWVIKCIAHAAADYPAVHALRKGRRNLVLFDDIDISMMVEKEVDNTLVPIPLVIRNAGGKNISELYDDIDRAKNHKIKSEADFVLEKNRKKDPIKFFTLLPQCIRLIIWKIILSKPQRVKEMMGTVIVTSVGMMGNVKGWVVPFGIHPLCFALGSIVQKPGVHKNAIEIREYLEMTILIDHDVIDGAPAARFAAHLVNLMENSYDL